MAENMVISSSPIVSEGWPDELHAICFLLR